MRPGTYSFHVTGTVHGQKIDETFTSSEKTFDNIAAAKEVEFPAKDPTSDELATKVDQLGTRAEATAKAEAKKAKDDASKLGIAGIVIGLVGVVVGGVALAGSRRAA